MRLKVLISLLLLAVSAGLAISATSKTRGAIMLEIMEGDTAFMVDEQANKVWWVVGECRRPLPLENGKKSKNLTKSMTSKVISNDVRIGSHRVELHQQFRFNVTTDPASAEVYNSMRGGWSSIPVQVNTTCDKDAACIRRMELPEC